MLEENQCVISLCNSSHNRNQRGENFAKPILFKFPTILVKLDGIAKKNRRPHKDSIYNKDLLEQETRIGSINLSIRQKRVESVIELTESTQKF